MTNSSKLLFQLCPGPTASSLTSLNLIHAQTTVYFNRQASHARPPGDRFIHMAVQRDSENSMARAKAWRVVHTAMATDGLFVPGSIDAQNTTHLRCQRQVQQTRRAVHDCDQPHTKTPVGTTGAAGCTAMYVNHKKTREAKGSRYSKALDNEHERYQQRIQLVHRQRQDRSQVTTPSCCRHQVDLGFETAFLLAQIGQHITRDHDQDSSTCHEPTPTSFFEIVRKSGLRMAMLDNIFYRSRMVMYLSIVLQPGSWIVTREIIDHVKRYGKIGLLHPRNRKMSLL